MKRVRGVQTEQLIWPETLDYAPASDTVVALTGYQPPAYYSWTRNPKAFPSLRHFAVCAGDEDLPSSWIYPQAIDLCGAGFMQLVRWRALETAEGVYDFSRVVRALDWMKANRSNKTLYIRLRDKSYISSNNVSSFLEDTKRNLPDYLASHTYSVYQGGKPAGWGAQWWDPYVRDRYLALIRAMASTFGSHEAFEGLVFDESTLSLPYPWPKNFDPALNLVHRQHVLSEARSRFGSKVVVQPINFFEKDPGGSHEFSKGVIELTNWCLENNIVPSLVDTCPTSPSFWIPMSSVLLSSSPCFAMVDAGRVTPRSDMSSGAAVGNISENFRDIRRWVEEYEFVTQMFWPIANADTFTALGILFRT